MNPRTWKAIVATALILVALFVAALPAALPKAHAAAPTNGTLDTGHTTITYNGAHFVTANTTGQPAKPTPTCSVVTPCDTFNLTVTVPASYANTYTVKTIIAYPPKPGIEYDVYIFDSSGALVTFTASGSEPTIATFPAATGAYSVTVVPFTPDPTVPATSPSYTGTITLVPNPMPATPATQPVPGFVNYPIPATAPYSDTAGEPSIGADWKTGAAMYKTNMDPYRVTFDDTRSPATATWIDRPTTTTVTSFDPILFLDHLTNRTFVSDLLPNKTSQYSFSDDDGQTYMPGMGFGVNSGADHQTIGGGPFAAGGAITQTPTTAYPDAVYYCSQDIETAECALSRDGGLTYTGNGVAVPIYNATQCIGIHGHVKVAPDGTVYVPNKSCGANQGMAVSTDNGLNWTVRTVPDSNPGEWDPSIGIGTNNVGRPVGSASNTIYFGYDGGNSGPALVAVSHDRGLNWSSSVDVGAAFGIQNTAFPAVVAGDDNRAAFAFLGSTTGGDGGTADPTKFNGVWRLYIAYTYDGGQTWVTTDATPNDPVQRGPICDQGTLCPSSPNTRNLLDFMDATVDKLGRVLVGYADGCINACAQGTAGNTGDALATIARQSSGLSLFAQSDPAASPTAAGTMSPVASGAVPTSTTATGTGTATTASATATSTSVPATSTNTPATAASTNTAPPPTSTNTAASTGTPTGAASATAASATATSGTMATGTSVPATSTNTPVAATSTNTPLAATNTNTAASTSTPTSGTTAAGTATGAASATATGTGTATTTSVPATSTKTPAGATSTNTTLPANTTTGTAISTATNTLTSTTTSTALPATSTNTRATPTSTTTSTPTSTNTPTNTSTSTSTPTNTNTPVPPTNTGVPTVATMINPTATIAPSTPTAIPTTAIPTTAPATTATATPTPPRYNPRIALSPGAVLPGAVVVVRGRNFAPGEQVTLALDGAALLSRPVTVVTGPTGRFTAHVVAPNSLLAGPNSVSAIGVVSHVAALATLVGLRPSTRLYLAGGELAPGVRSLLQALNPSNRAAAVSITLYFADGTVGHASVTLGAHSQRQVPLDSLTAHRGAVGLVLSATAPIAAQLTLLRTGRDGDSILARAGLDATWYLAEGYTGGSFHETVAILNPNPIRAARVTLRLLALGGRGSRTVVVSVPAHSEQVVDVNRLLPGRSLSIVATSDRGIVVERGLTFSRLGRGRGAATGFGLTTRAGVNVASSSWLFAEGSTANRFETFLTILNPGTTAAHVTARFYGRMGNLLGSKTLTVAGLSRANIRLNGLMNANGIASTVMADQPIVVERPEYFGSPNAAGVAGSDVFGSNGSATRWSFPGGRADGNSEFLLLFNPSAQAIPVALTFYGADGRTVNKSVMLRPNERATLDVRRLAPRMAALHGVTLRSPDGQGFVVEQTVFASDLTTLRTTQGLAQ